MTRFTSRHQRLVSTCRHNSEANEPSTQALIHMVSLVSCAGTKAPVCQNVGTHPSCVALLEQSVPLAAGLHVRVLLSVEVFDRFGTNAHALPAAGNVNNAEHVVALSATDVDEVGHLPRQHIQEELRASP